MADPVNSEAYYAQYPWMRPGYNGPGIINSIGGPATAGATAAQPTSPMAAAAMSAINSPADPNGLQQAQRVTSPSQGLTGANVTQGPEVQASPLGLDSDLSSLLQNYLSTLGLTGANLDMQANNAGVSRDQSLADLARSRLGVTNSSNANLADRGLAQSGIALKAMSDIGQNFDNQSTQVGVGYNNQISDIGQRRLQAQNAFDTNKAALWNQQTDRTASADQAKQIAEATRVAATPIAPVNPTPVAPEPASIPFEAPAPTPVQAIRQIVPSLAPAAQQKLAPAPKIVKPVPNANLARGGRAY